MAINIDKDQKYMFKNNKFNCFDKTYDWLDKV